MDDTKEWLQINDNSQDILVMGLLNASTQAIINYLHRDPRQGTYIEYYNGTQSNQILVNNYPISNVISIAISPYAGSPTSNIINPSYIFWDDDIIYRGDSIFPRGNKNIGINYTAGLFDPNLDSIYLAARYIVKAFWAAMSSDMNVSSESFSGVLSQSYWQTGPGSIPPQAKLLLEPFVSRWKAR